MANAFKSATEGGDDGTLKAALTALFTALMNANAEAVKQQLDKLLSRKGDFNLPSDNDEFKEDREAQKRLDLNELIPRLASQYPGDVGVFAPFLLNAFSLSPGEAIFLGPNEPHAYLDGDCVEAMACSDNVVRAGLTPKLRDVPTLCSMLTYKAMLPHVYTGTALDDFTKAYTPPVEEFLVHRTALPSNTKDYAFPVVNSHSIVLVYSGEGTVTDSSGNTSALRAGSTLLVQSGKRVVLSTTTGLVLFRCSSNNAKSSL